jgi:hypothetical protein
MRYYLEIVEDGHRIPVGATRGYPTHAEAREAAKNHVDDALPRNIVRVLAAAGHAYLQGDGEVAFQPQE